MTAARRIVLIGVTGTGKSTLAAEISAATGIPWTSTDDLIWEPGWVMVDLEVRRRRFAELADGERWVLDSLPTSGRDTLLARAELVVALDYPRWVSLLRLLRRTAHRVRTQEQICNGNTESLREVLSRRSILVWHAQTFTERRRAIRALEAAGRPPVVRLTSQRATDRWLGSIARP